MRLVKINVLVEQSVCRDYCDASFPDPALDIDTCFPPAIAVRVESPAWPKTIESARDKVQGPLEISIDCAPHSAFPRTDNLPITRLLNGRTQFPIATLKCPNHLVKLFLFGVNQINGAFLKLVDHHFT